MNNKFVKIIILVSLYLLCVFTTQYFKSTLVDWFWITLFIVGVLYYLSQLNNKLKKYAEREKNDK